MNPDNPGNIPYVRPARGTQYFVQPQPYQRRGYQRSAARRTRFGGWSDQQHDINYKQDPDLWEAVERRNPWEPEMQRQADIYESKEYETEEFDIPQRTLPTYTQYRYKY